MGWEKGEEDTRICRSGCMCIKVSILGVDDYTEKAYR